MNGPVSKLARCAIYTRKSTEHNLELAFNSLDAQREACEAYIKSQAHEGWRLILGRYDDGAFSGALLERPALQQLLAEVRAGKIDIVLVYKVERPDHRRGALLAWARSPICSRTASISARWSTGARSMAVNRRRLWIVPCSRRRRPNLWPRRARGAAGCGVYPPS